MKTVGIICEYNPLHLGHKKQLDLIRSQHPGASVVCLMSGNFVQRGKPAIVDKSVRAKAAVLCGADLVLELPVTASLSSAEGFASEGVRILSSLCDSLCFGAETGDQDSLMTTARALLSPEFSLSLRENLDKGLSFPAARQAALEQLGVASTVSSPNDILATEYCKAILQQESSLVPMVIRRLGSYHDDHPHSDNPSATAVRKLMLESGMWLDYVPEEAKECFRDAALHTMAAGERAVLTKLRTMRDEEFEALPHRSEGLWRKFMHNSRRFANLEDILTATKSKRYTRTRLDRMAMCAFLGITEGSLSSPAPYVRVLAFNDKGRSLLRRHKESFPFLNAGDRVDDPYQLLEDRCGDLYGLFALDAPEPPGVEGKRRVVYVHE